MTFSKKTGGMASPVLLFERSPTSLGILKSLLAGLLLFFCVSLPALALDRQTIEHLASDDFDQQRATLDEIAAKRDAAALPFLEDLLADRVKRANGRVVVIDGAQATDAIDHVRIAVPEEPEDVTVSNALRGAIEATMATLELASPDPDKRLKAARFLQDAEPETSTLDLIRRAEAQERDRSVRGLLRQMVLVSDLQSGSRDVRLKTARALNKSYNVKVREALKARLAVEKDGEIRDALTRSMRNVDWGLKIGENLGVVFSGVSLASILLLAALGLAITYGLMGVINMAHGEMMMIGAYATYVVQNLFRAYAPEAFQWYLLLAAPVAFLAAAVVGVVIERSVIRFLYGRTLETLLATWGVSLILIQLVRSIFGAQNVQVENPVWMSGRIWITDNFEVPVNRAVILAFSIAVLMLVSFLLSKTRLGLFVRAVTQNRGMARCVGVDAARIDRLAFALGSGVAGLAGVALSQIGNVGPDLGQHYIIDSFMVVVLGGVGQLAGAVIAALGLGVASKVFENLAGAVLAEIALLFFIVIFIQRRPQGLFALGGRQAD